MSTWTQACNLSMPNQWARSRQLSISTRTQACNLSMPNQCVFTNLCYMFSSYTYLQSQIYIIVVKLITIITIRSCITSFAYLRINAVRFTDNVQRNLSRCVQTVFITF